MILLGLAGFGRSDSVLSSYWCDWTLIQVKVKHKPEKPVHNNHNIFVIGT